jgi:hypothetical protein
MNDEQALALIGDVLHRKPDGGDRHVDDEVDLFAIVPLPGDAGGDVRLDLMIGLPKTVPPKSSTAICAAATEPGPSAAEEGPDMSVSTPILTTSSETCALAGSAAVADNAASATRHKRRMRSSLECVLFVSFLSAPAFFAGAYSRSAEADWPHPRSKL